MRNLLIGIALLVSAAVQAVNIKWNIPNAGYNWVNEVDSVYFVYSESALDPSNNYEADTSGGLTHYAAKLNVDDGVGWLYGDIEALTSKAGGYYYAVFINKNDSAQYAVAGGKQYVKGGSNGIYAQDVLGPTGQPEYGNYVDVSFIGGTWSQPRVPEPTTLALLALGVAGLALRRRCNG